MAEPRKTNGAAYTPPQISARVQLGKSWQQVGAQAVRLSRNIFDQENEAVRAGDYAEAARLRARRMRVQRAALQYQGNFEQTYGARYDRAGFVDQDWANTRGYRPMNYYSYTRRNNRRG